MSSSSSSSWNSNIGNKKKISELDTSYHIHITNVTVCMFECMLPTRANTAGPTWMEQVELARIYT